MSVTSQINVIAPGMKILFAYKGRYQIRDTTTIEYLSSLAKKFGCHTDLVYDQDTFGVTDNVLSVPFLNKMFSKDQAVVDSIIKKDPQMVVFLDGFTQGPWNRDISKAVKEINKDISCVGLFHCDSASLYDEYDYVLIGEPESSFKKFFNDKIFNGDKGGL